MGGVSHFLTLCLRISIKLPGVSSAALNPNPPFNDWTDAEPFWHTGPIRIREPGQEPTLEWQATTPGYFRTLEIPLVAGRDFDAHDLHGGPSVVIIDEPLARRYFPDSKPNWQTNQRFC